MSLRDELNVIHIEKEKIENETYQINLNNCINQIKFVNNHSKTKTTFIIPVFLLGRPPYNNKKCIKFIINKLRLQGIVCSVCESNRNKIFINWGKKHKIDPEEVSEGIEKIKKENTDLFSTPLSKSYDITDIQMFKKLLK